MFVSRLDTNWTVQLFNAAGASSWMKVLPVDGTVATLQTRIGELLFLAHRYRTPTSDPQWRFVRITSDGAFMAEISLPNEASRTTSYQALIEIEEGFLLVGSVGYSGLVSGGTGYAFVHSLSPNYQTVWQRSYGDVRGDAPAVVFFQETGAGSYLIGCVVFGLGYNPIWSITPEGMTNWTYRFPIGPSGQNQVSIAVKCADGGYLLGANLGDSSGGYSAQFFGQTDYWLIRLDDKGNRLWDRSYGGTGYETLASILQTADSGFLVSGESRGSGVTGNKGIDGDGFWILKLDSLGLKEAEFMLNGSGYNVLLAVADRYRLVGSHQFTDLQPTSKVHLEAKSVSKPFNVDVSTDLYKWTPVIMNYRGNIVLEEIIQKGTKFYRAVDAR